MKRMFAAPVFCMLLSLNAPAVLALAPNLSPQEQEQVKLKSAIWMAQRSQAEKAVKAKNFANAEALYLKIIEERRALKLDLSAELDLLGNLYLDYGKKDKALSTYREMVADRERGDSNDPGAIYALERLARAQEKVAQKTEAAKTRARIAKMRKDGTTLPIFAPINGPVGSPARVAEAEKLRQIGNRYMRYELQQKALVYFDRAVALDPGNAQALRDRAETFRWFDRNPRALQDLSQAIKLKPDFARAYFERGLILESTGKLGDAMVDFDRALKLEPANAEVLGYKAKLLERQGKRAAAITVYGEAIKAAPDLYWPYIQRAVAYTAAKDYKLAAADYTTLIERSPEDPEYYDYRREVYLKAQDNAKAQADAARIDAIKKALPKP